jgi:predicted RNA binding protein YcfA (HicA-like mRNA interferase family)
MISTNQFKNVQPPTSVFVPSEFRRVTVAGKDSTTVPAGTLASIRRATGLDELR